MLDCDNSILDNRSSDFNRYLGTVLSADAHLLKTLERRNRELEVLIEIGKALTSTVDLKDILAVIMDHVSRLLNTQAWSLMLRDGETGDLTFEIAVSPARRETQGNEDCRRSGHRRLGRRAW